MFKKTAFVMALFVVQLLYLSACGDDNSTEPTGTGSISGTLNLPAPAAGRQYAVLIDNDIDGDNGSVALTFGTCGSGLSHSYSISDVAAGTYFVYAVVFLTSNSGPPQSGDYVGISGGTFSNPPAQANVTVPASGAATADITLGIMP